MRVRGMILAGWILLGWASALFFARHALIRGSTCPLIGKKKLRIDGMASNFAFIITAWLTDMAGVTVIFTLSTLA